MNLIIKHLKSFASYLLNKSDGYFLHLCFVLLFIHLFAFPAGAQVEKPSRQAAEAAWTSGDYETAYRNYNGLLLLYSRDPSYGYYTGACLVMLQRDVQRAVNLLGSASHSSQNVKTIPDEIWFYYGRALQLSGNYSEATDAYEKYIRVAGKKRAQELGVQDLLTECAMGKGAVGSITSDSDKGKSTIEKTEPGVSKQKPIYDSIYETAGKHKTVSENKVPKAYDKKLTQAVRLQYMSDSLLRIAEGIRKQIDSAPRESVGLMKSRVMELENQAGRYLTTADSIFMVLEPDTFTKMPDTANNELYANPVIADDLNRKPSLVVPVVTENLEKPLEKEQKKVFSFFEIKAAPVYSASNPIPIDKKMPQGLIYHIQLAAFKNPVTPSYFRNLYPVFGMINGTNGVTYYYTGMFRTHDAAASGLPAVKSNGFTDAFIVAFSDNIQVSMEKAAQLENIWADKPLFYEKTIVTKSVASDTIPAGTLTFRAEVLRSAKPVKPDVTEKIELLAGNKGVDIIKNIKGGTIILIGNFITFESADEYVSLLVRNGYSAAKVVAYVGSNEIPVETAKELFKKLLNE